MRRNSQSRHALRWPPPGYVAPQSAPAQAGGARWLQCEACVLSQPHPDFCWGEGCGPCYYCCGLQPAEARSTSTLERQRRSASLRRFRTRPWSSVRGRREAFGRSQWYWGGGCDRFRVASLALSLRPRIPHLFELFSSSLFRLSPGNYRTQLYDKQREEYQPATPGLGMFVEVKDPEDKVSWPTPGPASSKLRYFFVSFLVFWIEEYSWCCGKIPIFSTNLGRGCWTGSVLNFSVTAE